MAARWTDEGRAQGGPPVDADGNRIPRDELTWRDADGEEIPFYDENGKTNLTYDHDTPVVEHWNGADDALSDAPAGKDMSRADRADAFNDPDNLTPMSRSDNSAKGGNGQTYGQETGPNYSNNKRGSE